MYRLFLTRDAEQDIGSDDAAAQRFATQVQARFGRVPDPAFVQVFEQIYEQLATRDPSPLVSAERFMKDVSSFPLRSSHIGDVLSESLRGCQDQIDQGATRRLVLNYYRRELARHAQTHPDALPDWYPLAEVPSGMPWWQYPKGADFLDRASQTLMTSGLLQRISDASPDLIAQYGSDKSVGRKLVASVRKHVDGGHVTEEIAAMFLGCIIGLNHLGRKWYGAAISADSKVDPQIESRWTQLVRNAFARCPNAIDQQGAFLHFNPPSKTTSVVHRLYISCDPSKDPSQVFEHWLDALEHLGLAQDVYCKASTTVGGRADHIILYVHDGNTDSEISALVSEFQRRCPSDFLGEGLATGVEKAKGITIGPEPKNLNGLFKVMAGGAPTRSDRLSFSMLMSALFYLAFHAAHEDASQNGATPAYPKDIKEQASAIFWQLLDLAGIEPSNLVPKAQGGTLPDWVPLPSSS